MLVRRVSSVLFGAVVLLAAGAGCASTYDFRRVYEAGPGQAGQTVVEDGVEAVVWIPGIRHSPDGRTLLDVGVSVHNSGGEPLQVDPMAIEVTDVAGRVLPGPDRGTAQSQSVEPGADAGFTISLPFPEEPETSGLDLEGLQVRLPVRSGDGAPRTLIAVFQRQPVEYYDRYPRRAGVGYRRIDLEE
jgi:hypothetical protein